MENTKITIFKGGSKQKTLPIKDVQIPDLYLVLEDLDDNGIRIPPNQRTCILECWHICGALKKHIEEH